MKTKPEFEAMAKINDHLADTCAMAGARFREAAQLAKKSRLTDQYHALLDQASRQDADRQQCAQLAAYYRAKGAAQ